MEMMALWLPREWPGQGHRLWWSPQLEQPSQLELLTLMVPEYQSEVVAGVLDAAKFDEGQQQYAGPAKRVCLPSAGIEHCAQWLVS